MSEVSVTPGERAEVIVGYVDNIELYIGRATAEELREGKVWYERAYSTACAISAESGYPVPVIAACLAVTSSQCSWPENVLAVRKIVHLHTTGHSGERPASQSGYPAGFKKAYAALSAYDSDESSQVTVCNGYAESKRTPGRMIQCKGGKVCGGATVHGEKHAPFFGSIMLDPSEPTIDVHATRVVRCSPDEVIANSQSEFQREGIPGADRDDIATAYKIVAERRGWDPVQAQAVPWLVIQRYWLKTSGAQTSMRDPAIAERAVA